MPYINPIQVDTDTHDVEQHYIHYGHLQQTGSLVPLQYGWHETPRCYGYGPTIRDHFLLHFVRSGRGKVIVHNRQYMVGPGHCFAIFPHQITYYEADANDPWMYYWLGFEGEWAADMMASAGFSDERIAVAIPHAEDVFAILEDLGRRMDHDEFFLLLTGQVHAIFYHLNHRKRFAMPHVGYDEIPAPMPNEYVRILLSIIHTSFAERINVQALANRLGLNRSYMTELFHRHAGQSIKAYLHEYRLQQALLLLQHPQNPIKTIAIESGFQDPLYFSRAFRLRFGVSPQQYRALELKGVAMSARRENT